MTKTYALKRLLEHGELSSRDIELITRWSKTQVWHTITKLQQQNIVRKYPHMKWGLIALWPYPTTDTSLSLPQQESYFAHTN